MDTIREKQNVLLDKMLTKLESMPDQTTEEFQSLLAAANELHASMIKSDQNDTERLKIQNSADVEKLKCESASLIEAAKADKETKIEKGRSIGTFLNTLVNGALTVLSVLAGVWCTKATIDATNKRFEMATAKEEYEPITTLTDRTTVQDGLRDNKAFKFFH